MQNYMSGPTQRRACGIFVLQSVTGHLQAISAEPLGTHHTQAIIIRLLLLLASVKTGSDEEEAPRVGMRGSLSTRLLSIHHAPVLFHRPLCFPFPSLPRGP